MLTIKELKEANLINEMKLLHFHVGSQISDISVIKDALQEASQIFVELSKLGAPMKYIDVGGGLGIDFDGTKTSSNTSTNYSLQNYANDVIATIKDSCKINDMKLLHFHIGSQISDIAVIKDALQEASQIYVELCKLGAPMQYIDCLLYTSPSPRDKRQSRMPSSA